MTKKAVTAKLSPKTRERLEEWADREEISRSEAVDRLLSKALDIEQGDNVVVFDGGTPAQKEQVDEVIMSLDEFDKELDTAAGEIETMERRLGSVLIGIVALLLWSVWVLSTEVSLLVSLGFGAIVLCYLSYYLFALGGFFE